MLNKNLYILTICAKFKKLFALYLSPQTKPNLDNYKPISHRI